MNVLAKDLWAEVRDQLRVERGPAPVDLWLKNTRPVDFARGVFTLAVPTRVVKDWLEHRYRDDIEGIFQRLTGSPVKMALKVDAGLPLLAAATDGGAELAYDKSLVVDSESDFVVLPENRLASAAVSRVLKDVSTGNPVVLYGGAGTGKSALVQYHLKRSLDDSMAVRTSVSITAEAFSQGLVRAIRENDVSAFRGRMLAADAFVLEEAHRLRGKTRTQREVLSVLRYYLERGRPVILTSRHPPNAIFLLDEALRSYFLSGVLLRIADSSAASRVRVLEARAKRFARPVPLVTIERVVDRIPGSLDRQVRFLEKVAAYAALAEREPTPEFVAERFPELAGRGDKECDLPRVIQWVAERFGSTPQDIASARKVRSCVVARHLVIYVATEVFGLSARRVARHLGGLSPSTTAYARRKIEQLRRDDALFDARVRRLLDDLNAGQKMLF
ncbi:MAG: hypothetical protein IPH13_13190 [Planctomycetes bacterium]|nr:hypothetical protein [Planctomycetota bacterium]MCC7172891.1 hypothetical protein [Planctomycetota bacterium]